MLDAKRTRICYDIVICLFDIQFGMDRNFWLSMSVISLVDV